MPLNGSVNLLCDKLIMFDRPVRQAVRSIEFIDRSLLHDRRGKRGSMLITSSLPLNSSSDASGQISLRKVLIRIFKQTFIIAFASTLMGCRPACFCGCHIYFIFFFFGSLVRLFARSSFEHPTSERF